MSLEVLLIPLGIAAYAALKESRSTDLCEKCKSTRITDRELLCEALKNLGATDLRTVDNRIEARMQQGQVTFQKVGETFMGRVDNAAEAVTLSMLGAVDTEVGRITQQRSIESMRLRATELGLTLIEERASNGTVQLVFEEA